MKKRRKISLCYFGEGNGQGGAESGAASGAAYDTGPKAIALGNTPEKDGGLELSATIDGGRLTFAVPENTFGGYALIEITE